MGKVNVDHQPRLASLAGVRGIPSVVLYVSVSNDSADEQPRQPPAAGVMVGFTGGLDPTGLDRFKPMAGVIEPSGGGPGLRLRK